jgi:hypothetical protein
MILALALSSILNINPVQIPFLATEPVLIARSYGGSRSSFSRSYSGSRSSFTRSSPTRISSRPSTIRTSSAPSRSAPKTVSITRSVDAVKTSSSPVTNLGPRLQSKTVSSLKGADGTISITRSAPAKPVVIPAPTKKPVVTATPPRNTIPSRSSYPTREYDTYSSRSPVIVHQDSTFSSPWFWMYMMDRDNNQPQPQVIQQAPVVAEKEVQQPQPQVVTKTIVKEERNPLKDFALVSVGVLGGIPLGGYAYYRRRNIE